MAKHALLILNVVPRALRGKVNEEVLERLLSCVSRMVSFARGRGIPLVFVVDLHLIGAERGCADFKSALHELVTVEELRPRRGDHVICKRNYDAFAFTDLDLLLRELSIDTIILVGAFTHLSVQQTAMGALYRRYRVIVPAECVADESEYWHGVGLRYMRERAGADVVSLGQLMKRLEHEISREECPRYL